MGSNPFTKTDALVIADKLGAEIIKKKAAHHLAKVWHEGKVIAYFGIRRGSKKDLSHGHLPESLHITQKDAKRLSLCPMSREEWIEKMRDAGLV